MEFRLLGPIEVVFDGRPLDLGPPQRRAVLVALLVDIGTPTFPEALIDRVWGENAPPGARRALHAHIAHIRTLLREAGAGAGRDGGIRHRSGGYVVDVDPDQVDLHRFKRLLAGVRRPQSDVDRAGSLHEALSLWRGSPLAGLSSPWATRTRYTWSRIRLDAAVLWAETSMHLGRAHEVIGEVRELAGEYPLAEPLVAALMQALATAGREAEALECYAVTRARLIDELGCEPGLRLQALHRTLLGGVAAGRA